MMLVMGGGLANTGAPVFNHVGKAVGWVNYYSGQQFLLHTTLARRGDQTDIDPMEAVVTPPRLFVPTKEFMLSLNDPPVAGEPLKLAWLGTPNLSGLNKRCRAGVWPGKPTGDRSRRCRPRFPGRSRRSESRHEDHQD